MTLILYWVPLSRSGGNNAAMVPLVFEDIDPMLVGEIKLPNSSES